MKQVRLALDKLKRTNEIVAKGQGTYTLVTIVNYDLYQLSDTSEGKQRASNRANEGQQHKNIYKNIKKNNIRFLDFEQNTNEDLNNLYEN